MRLLIPKRFGLPITIGLLAALTQGQAAKTKPDEAVLIVHNLCAGGGQSAKASVKTCETVIKKEDFDNLTAALDPNMPEADRLVLATQYVKLLVLGHEAERRKLDQQAAFQQLEKFTRLQLLQRQLVRALEAETSSISAEEIAQYYREHPANFEEGSFRRIYIPRQSKAGEAEAAQAIQQRATKGEDFDTLQREVWTAQGRPAGAPPTSIGILRRSSLPGPVQSVFDLKPGAVSALIADADGYNIYKMESKRVIPLETASSELRSSMASARLQERIRKLRSAVMISVNEDYFGALPSTEELAKHHGLDHSGSHMMPMTDAEKTASPRKK